MSFPVFKKRGGVKSEVFLLCGTLFTSSSKDLRVTSSITRGVQDPRRERSRAPQQPEKQVNAAVHSIVFPVVMLLEIEQVEGETWYQDHQCLCGIKDARRPQTLFSCTAACSDQLACQLMLVCSCLSKDTITAPKMFVCLTPIACFTQ